MTVRAACHLRTLLSPIRRFSTLTHLDSSNNAAMVNVTTKDTTARTAIASATVDLTPPIYDVLKSTITPQTKKGDVFTVAQIAGILAAKKTPDLIPLCHTVPLTHTEVHLELNPPESIFIKATASTTDRTGVEMEALTAASVAALTVYDMCKAAGKGITIRDIRLVSKTGGKSDWINPVETSR